MKRKPVTAEELMTRLRSDPEWLAREERSNAELRERELESARIQAPLIADLESVGWHVTSVWDLVNTAARYPEALPVLLDHLQRDYPAGIREGIARAMAVRDARFAWPVLRQLFEETEDRRVKDGLAVALAASADRTVLGEVMELLREPRHGPCRLFLLKTVRRLRSPDANDLLRSLLDDPQLAKEVERMLSKRRQR